MNTCIYALYVGIKVVVANRTISLCKSLTSCVSQETMSLVLNHLHRVAAQSDRNKMGVEQLAMCLGPVLLCPSAVGADAASLEYSKHIEVLKYLLEIWAEKGNTGKH